MSFGRVPGCLLVLLGVAFVAAKPVQFIPEDLKSIHESISDELHLKWPEIGSNPLFSFVFRSLNNSCQRRDDMLLMKATLDVYVRILSQTSGLLEGLPESSRHMLQGKMKELKKHLNLLTHEREEAFAQLNKIKVDDPLVQKKALAEFLEVYQAASVIGCCNC